MNQEALATLQAGLIKEPLPGGEGRERHGRGPGVVEAARLRGQIRSPHRHEFGRGPVPPEIGEPIHFIADSYFGHPRSDSFDYSLDVMAGNYREALDSFPGSVGG
jgi:hypothetical protein